MPVTYDFHLLPVTKIKVSKDRQRKELIKIDDLASSIARNGLLHPIVVTRKNELVSGERRLTAFKQLKLKEIPVHYLDELNPYETKAIELEENIKRVDLTWKESCLAAAEYHRLRQSGEPEWTRRATAEAIGLSPQHVSRLLQVAEALLAENKNVLAATNIDAAWRVIRRVQERAVKTEAAQIDYAVSGIEKEEEEANDETKADIFVENFTSWADSYSGRKFNFIHCDFPYGIKQGTTKYQGSETWDKYDDSFSTYILLLEALIKNKDKLFFPSAHLMFWFSMNHYHRTYTMLTKAGFEVNPFPLIWDKHNTGIIPDIERGPRRVYETAFHASLGDRKIISPVAGLTSAVPKKVGHITTKAQSMLTHFFRMFVDDLTEILDPTCGSGTALAAAKSLGANRIVGMDISEDYVSSANLLVHATKPSNGASDE